MGKDMLKTNIDWESTIKNANARANGVAGRFTDPDRHKFLIENEISTLVYDLKTPGGKQVAGLYNAAGRPYIENTMDASIVDAAGNRFSAACSPANGRMNSHRIGYYYYDFRFRDQGFVSPDGGDPDEGCYDILANTQNWGTNDVEAFSATRDGLAFTVRDAMDPHVYTALDLDAAEYDTVKITIKTELSAIAFFYIIAGAETQFTQAQNTSVKFISGRWNTLYVPLSAVQGFEGRLRGFRVDCGTEAGEQVEIRELKAIRRRKVVPFAFEHTFHTYPEKMHEVVRAVATGDFARGGRFELQIRIPEERVVDRELTEEYAAFDIKDTGVFGIILPAAEACGDLRVEQIGGNYVIIRGIVIPDNVKQGEELLFGHRLYTSAEHGFDGVREAAYTERHPLTDVSVTDAADNAKYEGYDALAGCYGFSVDASEFYPAYYHHPDKHYRMNIVVNGDGARGRTIYVRTAENAATRRGRLECAAMLDDRGRLLPIPLEVGKNFDGENEEPLYFPEKGTGAAAYGEVYVPITVGKDECKRFSMLHLYQNWGNYPLKQLSFIAFHIPYYHLSVGVTETNCITPYFVYGKDSWMLPDFRANSAPFWPDGVQHSSVGRLYFLQYIDAAGNRLRTESQRARIDSYGPVYVDVTMDFLSDDGKIKAEYRHVEMAQTDENRTFYRMRMEVLDDVYIKDFRRDFALFTFDSYTQQFAKAGYIDAGGRQVIEDVQKTDRIIRLGGEYPYFDYFCANLTESVNFGLIVRRSDIRIGGRKYDGRFVARDRYDGTQNCVALSLDLGETTLRKGDVLDIDIILMPWGYSTSVDDSNVRRVRQDSCVDPYKLTVLEGEPCADRFVPSLRAKDGRAVFRISGGKSTASVRVYGFDSYAAPAVRFKADGRDTDIRLAGVNGYDGYQVNRDADGTYSFAFNVNMDNAREYEITVEQASAPGKK
ncbi:MAG: hypothetical protein IJM24_05795 [Clostridia bacterium]|nr:hypothetical protein [Clostridia bacterium]